MGTKQGWWLNYSSGMTYTVDDHEKWIRRDNNAINIGLPPRLISTFIRYKPERDRIIFLYDLMRSAPIMRVRGHGDFVAIEFANKTMWKSALAMINRFIVDQEVGPKMFLNITNLASLESIALTCEEFLQLYRKGHKKIVETAVLLERKKNAGKRVSN